MRSRTGLGSACVSHAGERVLAIADFPVVPHYSHDVAFRKDSFGATPKPTRETRALPRIRRSRGRYRARDRQIPSPQFFHVWQFVETTQAKVIKKKLCRFIQKRTAGDFGASGDLNQAALH